MCRAQRRYRSALRTPWLVILSLLIALPVTLAQADAPATARASRPNFVFVLVDDMRWDVLSCAGHPFVKTPQIDRIARRGLRFANAFVTTSLCSPSRASFLTGTHACVHGVIYNGKMEIDPSIPTFPQILQTSGYETAYVGKWHMSGDPNPRPGFDYWLSFSGQGSYLDPKLNENGRSFEAEGYMTDLLTGYAVKFINKDHDKPFSLMVSHKAMHGDFIPAERHKTLYDVSDLKPPASFNDDLAGKPEWQRELAVRGGRQIRPVPATGIPEALEPAAWDPQDKLNTNRLNWHRTLAAVDEGVGRLLDALEARGLMDNTVVIFSSDNGFFLGEHRRTDKRLAYEESMRIPLLIGGAGVAHPGRVITDMALNIDMAPTLLALAGVPVPPAMQGRSLAPFMNRNTSDRWRTSFLYEYFKEDWLPGIPTMRAVRTDRWKYIEYPEIDDIAELYDLKNDPHEMTNLVYNPSAADQLARLKTELQRLHDKRCSTSSAPK